jgi:hypothetical protein
VLEPATARSSRAVEVFSGDERAGDVLSGSLGRGDAVRSPTSTCSWRSATTLQSFADE